METGNLASGLDQEEGNKGMGKLPSSHNPQCNGMGKLASGLNPGEGDKGWGS